MLPGERGYDADGGLIVRIAGPAEPAPPRRVPTLAESIAYINEVHGDALRAIGPE